jgi:hypothetical protein
VLLRVGNLPSPFALTARKGFSTLATCRIVRLPWRARLLPVGAPYRPAVPAEFSLDAMVWHRARGASIVHRVHFRNLHRAACGDGSPARASAAFAGVGRSSAVGIRTHMNPASRAKELYRGMFRTPQGAAQYTIRFVPLARRSTRGAEMLCSATSPHRIRMERMARSMGGYSSAASSYQGPIELEWVHRRLTPCPRLENL